MNYNAGPLVHKRAGPHEDRLVYLSIGNTKKGKTPTEWLHRKDKHRQTHCKPWRSLTKFGKHASFWMQ